MISPVTVSKIYSVLGNNDSLWPMAIKDTANGLGLTAGSYITGKDAESQDRFIDEFGSQAIWLFGIPVFKRVLDLGLFKPLGLDPGVDVRVLKDQDVFELAKKYAKQHDEQRPPIQIAVLHPRQAADVIVLLAQQVVQADHAVRNGQGQQQHAENNHRPSVCHSQPKDAGRKAKPQDRNADQNEHESPQGRLQYGAPGSPELQHRPRTGLRETRYGDHHIAHIKTERTHRQQAQ